MKRRSLIFFAIAAALVQGCGGSNDTKAGVATAIPGAKPKNPAAGGAGVGATAPAAAGSKKPASPTDSMMAVGNTTIPNTNAAPMPAMDECGLATQWTGDEFCIRPPAADKGFQVHIGPSNYDNPEAKYVLAPGQEVTETLSAVTGNDQDVYYYYRQYRMRPGSHHLIVYASGSGMLRRLGGTQNHIKDNPENGVIAPENQDVGMKLSAKTPLSISLHYINLTDKPILKEAWINFWYRDPSEVKQPANEIFSMAPMSVAPGEHIILSGSCPITQAGHVITLYGHRHANNLRFSAWRTRGAQRDLVFDDYDWVEPAVFEFSSLVTNPAPDPMGRVAGGWSGVLDLMPGDSIDFECEITNMTNSTFVGQNEAKNDEMCILVGDSVGAQVPARCTYGRRAL